MYRLKINNLKRSPHCRSHIWSSNQLRFKGKTHFINLVDPTFITRKGQTSPQIWTHLSADQEMFGKTACNTLYQTPTQMMPIGSSIAHNKDPIGIEEFSRFIGDKRREFKPSILSKIQSQLGVNRMSSKSIDHF